jgi:hypothetical protein
MADRAAIEKKDGGGRRLTESTPGAREKFRFADNRGVFVVGHVDQRDAGRFRPRVAEGVADKQYLQRAPGGEKQTFGEGATARVVGKYSGCRKFSPQANWNRSAAGFGDGAGGTGRAAPQPHRQFGLIGIMKQAGKTGQVIRIGAGRQRSVGGRVDGGFSGENTNDIRAIWRCIGCNETGDANPASSRVAGANCQARVWVRTSSLISKKVEAEGWAPSLAAADFNCCLISWTDMPRLPDHPSIIDGTGMRLVSTMVKFSMLVGGDAGPSGLSGPANIGDSHSPDVICSEGGGTPRVKVIPVSDIGGDVSMVAGKSTEYSQVMMCPANFAFPQRLQHRITDVFVILVQGKRGFCFAGLVGKIEMNDIHRGDLAQVGIKIASSTDCMEVRFTRITHFLRTECVCVGSGKKKDRDGGPTQKFLHRLLGVFSMRLLLK